MKQEKIYGKKTLGYYFKLVIVFPFWLLSDSKDKKSFLELKAGLMHHEHRYLIDNGRNPPPGLENYKLYRCSHFGCYVMGDYSEKNS